MQQKHDVSQLVEGLAETVGITVRPQWRDGVGAHFEAIASAAAEAATLTLDEAAEPAWHFEA
ncbi:AtzG-like protein [Breoghania corrubedonensis]|nr:AtzG-like protein [Breoghania corrubedonensis]